MSFLLMRLIHVFGMALWLAPSFFIGGDLKRSLATPTDLLGLSVRLKRSTAYGIGGMFATIITGFGLMGSGGGMAAMPWPIHAGMGLGLLAAVISGLSAGTTGSIVAALSAGKPADQVLAPAKRIRMLTGMFHGVFLATLFLMVFRTAL